MSRTRRLRSTILISALAIATAAQLPLAGSALAGTPFPVVGQLTITKASLKGGNLLIEGTTTQGQGLMEASSTTSTTSTYDGAGGKFRFQSSTFTAPDCRAVVNDFYHPTKTVVLTDCTPSFKPVPAQPAPPTGKCVINPVPAQRYRVSQSAQITLTTTGCTAAGALNWSLPAGVLPTGMQGPRYDLNDYQHTGVIGGTPTVPGTYRFTVQVSDDTGATDQENITATVS